MSSPRLAQPSQQLPLVERRDSQFTNTHADTLTIRIVPYSPPHSVDSSIDPSSETKDGRWANHDGTSNIRQLSRQHYSQNSKDSSMRDILTTGDDNKEIDVDATSADTFNSRKYWQSDVEVGAKYLETVNASFHQDEQHDTFALGQSRRRSHSSGHGSVRALEVVKDATELPGSALSSPLSLDCSLANRPGGVSGRPATLPQLPEVPASPVINTVVSGTVSSLNSSPSIPSSILHHPNQTLSSLSLPSLSPSLSPSPTIVTSHQGSHCHRILEEPPSPLLRPLSRRKNIVAINPDKTFTLLPQAERKPPVTARSPISSRSITPSTRSSGIFETGASGTISSVGSPPVSSTFSTLSTISTATASLSLDRQFFDAFIEDRSESPLTAIPDDRTATPKSPNTPKQIFQSSSPTEGIATDPLISLPWNRHSVGGLRKVPRTPEGKAREKESEPSSNQSVFIPALDFDAAESSLLSSFSQECLQQQCNEQERGLCQYPLPSLSSKNSFQSTGASTISERTNYKVYGHSSSPLLADSPAQSLPDLPSSSHSNIVVLGKSSPTVSSSYDILPAAPLSDIDSNENLILHPDPSPSVSAVAINRALRQAHSTDNFIISKHTPQRSQKSQDSLIIKPLHVRKEIALDRINDYRQRSRESLRSQTSLKSLRNLITHEAAHAFFIAPSVININLKDSSSPRSNTLETSLTSSSLDSNVLGGSRPPETKSASSRASHSSPVRVRMEAHPHIWSSQLSTVMSESEGGSESPGISRSPSALSGSHSEQRRSSGFSFLGGFSTRSRRVGSIGSSITPEESSLYRFHARSSSSSGAHLDRPQAVYTRASPGPSRTVRDQDEHGDGLADLRELHTHISRNGLGNIFRSSNTSDRNLHSSASSRSGSFTSTSLPAWVRIYYGSGERRLLSMPSISSLAETNSSPSASQQTGSPITDHLPNTLYSPRKRMREVEGIAIANSSNPERSPGSILSAAESTDLVISGRLSTSDRFRRSIRHKSSSVWSPHLGLDRYAPRYSIWNPPGVQWTPENGRLGRRNTQILLFISGFLFPAFWIVAALLPLPPDPKVLLQQEIAERGGSAQNIDHVTEIEYTRNGAADEIRYQSVRWWRTLNRFMALFGILLITAIIILVVVGTKEKWGG